MTRSAALAFGFVLLFIAQAASGAPFISLSTTAGARNLHLGGTGSTSTHIAKVAELTVTTDNPAGCTVAVLATALGKDDGNYPITLQLIVVESGAPAPGPSDFTRPPGTAYTLVIPAGGSHRREVYVRYMPKALQDPGIYTSFITATVTDN